jgi:hypothetical protein
MLEPASTFFVSVKTVNESNGNQFRGAQWLKCKKRKEAHEAVKEATKELTPTQRFPVVVRLTRLSAGVLDDDGLRSACKAVRDAVSKWLAVDDGDVKRIRFAYEQERCRPKKYGVRVEVFERCVLVEQMEAAQ